MTSWSPNPLQAASYVSHLSATGAFTKLSLLCIPFVYLFGIVVELLRSLLPTRAVAWVVIEFIRVYNLDLLQHLIAKTLLIKTIG